MNKSFFKLSLVSVIVASLMLTMAVATSEIVSEKKADSKGGAKAIKAVFATDVEYAQVGKPAPDFTLVDQNGKKLTLSSYGGKMIVLEWINPGCPFVVRHYKSETMTGLEKKYGSENLVWLRINSTNKGHRDYLESKACQEWAKSVNVDGPVLDDADGKVGSLYAAKTTPHMFMIDPSGLLVYSGAIDNDRYGKMEKSDRVNYVGSILKNWKDGKSIEPSYQKPYGCNVKYEKKEAPKASS